MPTPTMTALLTAIPGSEDLNADGNLDPGETNPLDHDTDNDGLFDGTEKGLTAPETADTDLLAAHFIADADPVTTTDPTDADSDDDGILDGNEDKNGDGFIDTAAGETDPGNPDSDGDGIFDGTEIGLTVPQNPVATDIRRVTLLPMQIRRQPLIQPMRTLMMTAFLMAMRIKTVMDS